MSAETWTTELLLKTCIALLFSLAASLQQTHHKSLLCSPTSFKWRIIWFHFVSSSLTEYREVFSGLWSCYCCFNTRRWTLIKATTSGSQPFSLLSFFLYRSNCATGVLFIVVTGSRCCLVTDISVRQLLVTVSVATQLVLAALKERAIVNQTNIGTVSKATSGKLLRDGVERIRAFPNTQIPSWTEPNCLVTVCCVVPAGMLPCDWYAVLSLICCLVTDMLSCYWYANLLMICCLVSDMLPC